MNTEPVCSVPAAERGPLFLLDGSNMAYRAFYALPQEIATSSGLPTNALYGFSAMVIKILTEFRPGAVIVAWDSREKTFRHEEFVEYKAQRKPMPDLLSQQWPYFPEIGEAFGFVNLAVPGFEADDILATLARQAEAEGRETFIVTGDRDALQLAGRHVKIMANARGVTDVKIYDPAAVEERFGVPPRLIPDLIGLKGDTSDNIPGIPGIGEKTAALLLQQFGDLDGVLANIDQVAGPKRQELLRENRELALMSRRLACLEHDAPIDIRTAELLPHELQRDRLEEFFARFEFHTLMPRLSSVMPVAPVVPERQAGSSLPAPRPWPAFEDRAAAPLDPAAPAGLAADAEGVWLAQDPTAGGEAGDRQDYRRFSLFRALGEAAASPALADALEKSGGVCHDFKSQPELHPLMARAAHDTYIGAYLLAPGRRDYRLDELATEDGIALPDCSVAMAGLPSAPAGGPAAATAGGAAVPDAAAAAAVVLPLAGKQEQALREQGMWDLFQEIELPLTRVLIEMENVGIFLDCYRLGEITGKIQDQMEGLESCIYDLAGEQFNLGSSQQLGRILFEGLGLPRQRKTKTGYSTDARTLESLRDRHPIVGHLLNHRELSKLMSTYLLALPQCVDGTGRLHTTFHQTVAATGRLSSSDPNLQNIPVRTALGAQIRECFSAPEGKLLVVADYSQIELHVMASLAGEPALLEALARGEDIHRRTAAEVFGMAPEDVDTTHRRYAKAVNFGIMYGQSSFGLSQSLGIEREEAADYIQRYFERLPRVKAFIEECVEIARRQGYATTVFGRRRPIPELMSANYQERQLGERLAVNSVIQGSAADLMKVAMIRCYARLTRDFPASSLVLQVHDELVFEVPEADVFAVRDAMTVEMAGAYPMEPAIRVDAGVGPDWLAAK